MKYPIILSPIPKERVWGGNRLKKYAGEMPIGEHWVLSVRDGDNNTVKNGPFAGRQLDEVLREHPEYLGKYAGAEKFPLLIKFIDSKESLSIQVHPDDETAALLGGEGGKTEMWYIIEAEPDSYIYFGMKDEVDVEEFRAAVLRGDDPTPFLNKVNVKAGDCFFIAGGTPHAIGGGIYLCEIQQNCDTTFRMYDYGRPRELHLSESAASLKKLRSQNRTDGNILASCEYFTSELLEVGGKTLLNAEADRFVSLTVVSGEGKITAGDVEYPFAERDSIFIPAGEEKYTILGNAQIIKTTV